jgi:hypothetical protein
VHLEGKTVLVPRTVWTELACVRAVLDKLEAVLDSDSEEQVRCDVIGQLADELERLARTMTRWEAERRAERGRQGPDHDVL